MRLWPGRKLCASAGHREHQAARSARAAVEGAMQHAHCRHERDSWAAPHAHTRASPMTARSASTLEENLRLVRVSQREPVCRTDVRTIA